MMHLVRTITSASIFLLLSSTTLAEESTKGVGLDALFKSPKNTIPPGVACKETTVCNGGSVCSVVCEHGTVEVSSWLKNSMSTQLSLAYQQSFCYAQLPGSHNAAITLADGYGNEDQVFDEAIKVLDWFEPWAFVRTNDQYFGLTDLLNMGVRSIELDIAWILDSFRIGHCGGVHVGFIDKFISDINAITKKLGWEVEWATDLLGCEPSMSSIPTGRQRHVVDALTEIATWMDREENKNEFVFVFFDCSSDMLGWGVVPKLLELVTSVFDPSMIYTMDDKAAFSAGNMDWPSPAAMMAQGKRVMFNSGADFGATSAPFIFHKGDDMCGWHENSRVDSLYPDCILSDGTHTNKGQLTRMVTSQLQYGILNADGSYGINKDVLNKTVIPDATGCNVNMLAPDLIDPARMELMVWSWAKGHPTTPANNTAVYMSESNKGRWYSSPADGGEKRVAACRSDSKPSETPTVAHFQWRLTATPVTWPEAVSGGAGCPSGFVFAPPLSPVHNSDARIALATAGVDAAWINYGDNS